MSSVDPLNLQAGDIVGGYTLISPLGSGAMGSVWRAQDGGGQEYAIKILRDSLTDDANKNAFSEQERAEQASARERLRREAMSLRRINHPGVCQIVDMELDDSVAFIVTELIEGLNLRDDVAANGRYTDEDLERLAEKLMDAVQAVHAAAIVHRDIKPTNVMISASGPVLVDFGIAMGEGESHVTRTGLVMGTPGFIAPEIINGDESDEESDWWSTMAVLAFAACGKPVFGSQPMMAVLERAASGNADLTGLPPRTMAAFRAALSPNRADRPQPQKLLDAISMDSLHNQSGQDVYDDQEDDRLDQEEKPTEVVHPFGVNSSDDSQARGPASDSEETFEHNPRLSWSQDQDHAISPDTEPDEGSEVTSSPASTRRMSTSSTPDDEGPAATARLVDNTAKTADSQVTQTSKLDAVAAPPEALPPAITVDPQTGIASNNPSSALLRRRFYLKYGGLVMTAIGILLAALAALLPMTSLLVAGITLWALCTSGLSRGGQITRELKRGGERKTADTALCIASLPWQLGKAFIMAFPRFIIILFACLVAMSLFGWVLGLPQTYVGIKFVGLSFQIPLLAGSASSLSGLVAALSAFTGWLLTMFTGRRPNSQPSVGQSIRDWQSALRIGAGALLGYLLVRDKQLGTNMVRMNRRRAGILFVIWLIMLTVTIVFVVQGPSLDWVPLTLLQPLF